jgi:hypothetical protein
MYGCLPGGFAFLAVFLAFPDGPAGRSPFQAGQSSGCRRNLGQKLPGISARRAKLPGKKKTLTFNATNVSNFAVT